MSGRGCGWLGALAVTLLVLGAGPAGASPRSTIPGSVSARAAVAAYPKDPPRNIAPSPAYPYFGACRSVRSSACQSTVIAELNHARRSLGQPSYALPSHFTGLTPAEQLLVLTNSDRALYHLLGVAGLNSTLNLYARQGVLRDGDPLPTGTSGGSSGWYGYAANWATGTNMSAPFAYYEWMYEDGIGSANIDCTAAHTAGCWGHRNNVLKNFGARQQIALGIGSGTSPSYRVPAWTQLFESFLTSRTLPYVPTITGLSVYSGPTSGGTRVAIRGYGFVHVRQVRFGSSIARLTPVSSTLVDAVAPPHSRASGHISVLTTGGISAASTADAYTYR